MKVVSSLSVVVLLVEGNVDVLLEDVGLVELNADVEYVVFVEFVVVFTAVHSKIHVCMLLLIVMFVIHVGYVM